MRGWTYVPGRREDDFHVLRLIERKDEMLDLGLTQGFKLCTMPLSSEQAREIGQALIQWADTGKLMD